MKITNVKIENFKGVESLDFSTTKKVNVIVGKNGVGKSSTLEAIIYCLTGSLPSKPIKDKAPFASVECKIDAGMPLVIKRVAKEDGNTVLVNEKRTTKKELEALLKREFNVTNDVLKNIVSFDSIMKMDAKELKEYVLSFVPADLTVDKLTKICSFTEDEVVALKNVFSDNTFGIEELRDAYTTFFEQRKFEKKDEAALTILAKDVPVPKLSLMVLEENKAKLLVEKQKASEYLTKLKEYENAVKKSDEQKELLSRKEMFLKENENLSFNPSELDSRKNQMKVTQNKKEDFISVHASLLSTINTLENGLKNLETSECPLSAKIICPATEEKKKVRKELQKQMEDAKKSLDKIDKQIAECNDSLEKFSSEIKRLELLKSKMIEITKEKEAVQLLKKNLVVIPEKPVAVDVKKIESDLKLCNEEILNVSKYQESMDAKKKLAEKKKSVATLDGLVTKLEPKGEVLEKVLGQYIDIFEKAVNDEALKFGMNIRFLNKNGLFVYGKSIDKKRYNILENLSSAEKIKVLYAFASMINNLSGTGVFLVDDLEKIDGDGTKTFANIVNDSDFETVFIGMVEGEKVNIFKEFDCNIVAL